MKTYLQELDKRIKTLEVEDEAVDVVNTIGQSLCDLNSFVKIKKGIIKVKT